MARLLRRNSLPDRLLYFAVALSPIGVLLHFLLQLHHGAYPPDADSIMIPAFMYLVLPFPAFLILAICGRRRLDAPKLHFFWNTERNWASLLWTVLCIYPIGAFVFFLILDAIHPLLLSSLIYTAFLTIALVVYRAGAISGEPS